VSLAALALVLAAAGLHAGWNVAAKRAGGAGPEFVWMFGLVSSVLFAPVAILSALVGDMHVDGEVVLFLAGSGVLHLGYFTLLQRGYRTGDLSVVYPLARGTGPALSTVGAIVVLGERPGGLTLLGGALVVGGVLLIGLRPGPATARSLPFGVGSGLFIAVYTLWDTHAVDGLAIPPLLQLWASDTVRAALLTPYVWRRREVAAATWAKHRPEVLTVAVLSPLAYLLVLTALTISPVSAVAPAREVSVLLGVAFGVSRLGEGDAARRLVAAALIAGGVVVLGVA
jgi:drug/metabolite transporter (DMT)-like permease